MPLKVFGGSLLLPLRIDGYTFDQLPYTPSVDERFSTQLKDQLPEFVTQNYETFFKFVEAYYEWSEQHGNPRAEGVRLSTYKDVDNTLDSFLEYFRNSFIKDFPFQLAEGVNEKTLIKNVGYMYRSKGSKASFDLLFRLLFNTTIDVDYPKDRILKLSSSTFDDRQFIRIAPIFSIDEAKTIENSLLVQRDPFKRSIYATALIDEVNYVHEGGVDFFSLAVQDISGTFTTENDAEVVTSGTTSAAYIVPVLPTLNALEINAGGTGYELGDVVVVNDKFDNRLLKAEINNIGPFGEIRGFNYRENFGVYRANEDLTFVFETSSGIGASLSGKGEVVLTDGPDSYGDDTGKLSGRSFIQDSFFYQNFSYIIRVNKSLQLFADAVRKLVHPSGSLMFAEYLNEVSMSGDAGLTSDSRTRFRPTIGHYLPHTFGTTLDPRGFTYTTAEGSTHYDFYPRGYNGLDGNTGGEFIKTVDGHPSLRSGINGASLSPYYLPHVYVTSDLLEQTHIDAGQSHDPDVFYWKRFSTGAIDRKNFNNLEGVTGTIPTTSILNPDSGNSITGGALGSTGYIGVTTDDDGESAGLGGYFPIGSSRPNIRYFSSVQNREAGVSHYGGYTSPPETSLSGGFSGGQIIQVVGTDSATADYWVVYRHPAHLGLTGLGVTGSRDIVRIPMAPSDNEHISTINPDNSGYSYNTSRGVTLNGTPYAVGEIVVQEKQDQPKAIGRVLKFEPSAFKYAGSETEDPNTPFYNIGIDILEVEVYNGVFTRGYLGSDFNNDGRVDGLDLAFLLGEWGATGSVADTNQDGIVDGQDLASLLGDWNQTPKPIVGESSGAARLVDASFASNIHTSVTFDTSWLDIPISIMVNDIEYSNVTN